MLDYCILKDLTSNNSSTWVPFPLLSSPSKQELQQRLSQKRTNQEKKKKTDGRTSSLQLRAMLLTRFTEGQTRSQVSIQVASHRPVLGCVTDGNKQNQWGKKRLPLNEADWQGGTDMSVGISGGKHWIENKQTQTHQVKGPHNIYSQRHTCKKEHFRDTLDPSIIIQYECKQ